MAYKNAALVAKEEGEEEAAAGCERGLIVRAGRTLIFHAVPGIDFL